MSSLTVSKEVVIESGETTSEVIDFQNTKPFLVKSDANITVDIQVAPKSNGTFSAVKDLKAISLDSEWTRIDALDAIGLGFTKIVASGAVGSDTTLTFMVTGL